MSWQLDSTTLPNPVAYQRQAVEIAKDNVTLDGQTRRDIVRQKWRYVLRFAKLTQAQVADIIALYQGQDTLSFSVSDGSLTINAVDVWMYIESRQYTTKGSEYREDMVIVLEEV